jgi:hypothetical protein
LQRGCKGDIGCVAIRNEGVVGHRFLSNIHQKREG